MTLDNVQALPLGTRLGDYRLDAVIGHGGFGITYRAFDSQLAKVVAIKEYLPIEFAVRRADGQVVARGARYADDFAWGRERFLEEARALARFRHPHIVPVLRFLEANGTAYTVMEFEDGRSVSQILQQTGRRLPPPDVLRLAAGMLSGMSAVHAQGFLHRDIKPSNIIVRRDGVPILIDFGAARQAMGGRTRTLTSVLTPQYAPIEQYALDGKQGPWTDIYSAAAVLHHAIAGVPPPEAAARVGADPYRPLAITQADRFDPAFLSAIDRALAFAPEQRPQTVEAWRSLFGPSLSAADNTPTQRIGPAPPSAEARSGATPRLGGARRGEEVVPPPPSPARPARGSAKSLVLVAVVVIAAAAIGWMKFGPGATSSASVASPSTAAATPTPITTSGTPPTASPSSRPAAPPRAPVPPTAASTQPAAPATPDPAAANKALVDQALHAAEEARAVLEKANDSATAAKAMRGEARIVAARAAKSDLENAQRVTADDGSSYVGQVVDGRRQGLGVADAKDGDHRAGEWQDNLMSGRGTDRAADGTVYEGQWRDGQPSGPGVMERPGGIRDEGTFASGKFEGPGVRRLLQANPPVVQTGDWHGDTLDGPAVETVGDRERYEGSFRLGKRHGYGQLTDAEKKVILGRWDDGKLMESVVREP